MRPIRVSLSNVAGGTASSTIPMDIYLNPFNVGVGVVVSGTVNYTVQHTFDDVFDSAVTPTWFPHATLASLAANADGNYAFAVRAVRLVVNSGSGTATMTLVQSGIAGN